MVKIIHTAQKVKLDGLMMIKFEYKSFCTIDTINYISKD
jgi:hypothetical protein